ncbi:MAG: zinc-ribbon and DUF3426 domain-containing protein [Xanthomonadales bacterium]|nr:zinc-ribbon and DUF3426 domain-containing protein [Xanthomonadales bacterium]
MYTQCPQCVTLFPIDVETLCTSHGKVRCGCCGAVFNALDALSEDYPADERIAGVFYSDRPPTLRDPDEDEEGLVDPELFFSPVDPDTLLDDLGEESEAPELIAPPTYSDVEPELERGRSATPWILATLVLTVTLVGQIAWFERDAWLSHPQVRPWLDRACAQIGCQLPPRRDLSRIRLVSRNIRPHPSVEGALMINATLRNEATFVQPYPRVEIELANLDGQPIAARIFPPEAYLEEGRDPSEGMAPGTLLPLVFEVVDPGEDAVAFEFTFR